MSKLDDILVNLIDEAANNGDTMHFGKKAAASKQQIKDLFLEIIGEDMHYEDMKAYMENGAPFEAAASFKHGYNARSDNIRQKVNEL